jgi:hypothetical protein
MIIISIIYSFLEQHMAFINQSPSRPINPLIAKSNGILNRPSSNQNFIDTFSGAVKPVLPYIFRNGVNFSLNMQKGPNSDGSDSNDGNGKGKGNGKGNGNNRNNGRSHNSKKGSFQTPEERGVSSISFSSGINPGFVINGYESSAFDFSTCFIQCGGFFDTIHESMYKTQLDEILFVDYLFEVQKRVKYNINKKFTEENFYKYFTHVSNALQLYYMTDSIIAHTQSRNIRHKNRGLMYLRSTFDAEILSSQQQLGEILKTVPIPPNLLNFIRYMYQNFTFSELPGHPIYRLGFRQTLHSTCKFGSISSQYYRVIIDELISDTVTIGILNSAFQDEFKFSTLPPSNDIPMYDKNFMSFWHNNDITYLSNKDKNMTHTRFVKDEDQDYKYLVFDDDMDGIFYASSTIFNEKTNNSETGIWSPLRDAVNLGTATSVQRTSLLCYYDSPSRFEALRSVKMCALTSLS